MWNLRAKLLTGVAMLVSVAANANEGSTAGAPGSGLEEIVVTAQRREEGLQEVPISITSVSGKQIEEAGYHGLTDLQFMVPGLQYDPTQGSAFQIRGVGSESFDFSNEKSVSVVVDDVVMDGQRDNGLTGLVDIQRVDVLMGPQGTLFGKGSTSGVVAITTYDPVLGETSGKVSAGYGERNDSIDNIRLNIPLGNQAAFRASAFYQGQSGEGRYTVLNTDLGGFQDFGFRAKLLWAPSDHLEILGAGDWAHHWDSSIRTAVSGAPASVTAQEIALGVTPGPKNGSDADGSSGSIRTDEYGGSLRVRGQVGQDTVTSISAARITTFANDTPADLVPGQYFAYIPYNNGRLSTSKVSEEIHWASPTGQFFEYLGGLFYNKLNADQTQLQFYTGGQPLISAKGVPLTTFFSTVTPSGSSGDEAFFQARNRSEAAFGQIKLNPTDRASIAFGGRYTNDRNAQTLSFPFVPTAPITGTTDKIIGTTPVPYQPYGSVSGSNFSYRVSPDYKLTDDVMVYASYATGYKPSGVAFVGSKYDPYASETVKSYELGEKSEFFDHRVRVDLDLFYETFRDFQATILTSIPGSILLQSVIGNAGGLKSQGAETNIAFKATDDLTLTGGLTYADTYFTNYIYNLTTNYTGTQLTNAPRWMGVVAANYARPIASDLQLQGNISYSYRSTVYTVVGDPAYSRSPGFGLLNLRASIATDAKALEVGVYARNLLNSYFSTGWQNYGTLGYLHYTSPEAYRTVGLFANYSF